MFKYTIFTIYFQKNKENNCFWIYQLNQRLFYRHRTCLVRPGVLYRLNIAAYAGIIQRAGLYTKIL
jgi:hypothetical protein